VANKILHRQGTAVAEDPGSESLVLLMQPLSLEELLKKKQEEQELEAKVC
jgi:hypothetical protein